MTANNENNPTPEESISSSNRMVGGAMVAFGILIAMLAASTVIQMKDSRDRDSAIASAALAVVLISVGSVIGFRDYLPKSLVAITTIGLGVLAMIGGIGTLAWVGYNLFIERQEEFRPGGIAMPFVMIAVGYGFIRKGLTSARLSKSS